MTKSQLTYNNKLLVDLQKSLKERYYIEVGILGDNATQLHSDSSYTNAQIGAVHEFGSFSRNIPRRSFLYDPIKEGVDDLMQDGAMNNLFNKYAKANAIRKWYLLLESYCESFVNNAFVSSFRGRWADLKRSTVSRRKQKGNVQQFPLMDTGQLRRSISGRVVKIK